MQIKTLTDFKRFVKMPGATIQVVRHDWAKEPFKPGFFEPRKIAKVQTNSVAFTMPDGGRSWLDYDSAKRYRFNGDTITVDLKQDGQFEQVMVYKCWIE